MTSSLSSNPNGSGGVRSAAELRSELGHPIIDTDAHLVEFMPVFEEYLAEFGGAAAVDHYRRGKRWFVSDDEARRRGHVAKPPWGYPIDARDHLTSMLPALFEERMGELGIDFAVVHPSPKRIGVPHLDDDSLRQPLCRALNAYMADMLRPHDRHLTPTAVIPMHTPVEAIEELEFAVGTLGMKASMLPSYVIRHDPDSGEPWWDNLALDSADDYDPVWARFEALGVVPAFHSGSIGHGSRISMSNSLYNFVGHFAETQASVCKALLLGGVTARFPRLPFAFEAAGVAWAVAMLIDLLALWEDRHRERVERNDPARFDLVHARQLFAAYAPDRLRTKGNDLTPILDRMSWLAEDDLDNHLDEFAAARIDRPADLIERFTASFYFASECGDRLSAYLQQTHALLPAGARLKPIFATDLGHFTSIPQNQLVPTAYASVENGWLSTEAFQAMTFDHPVEMFTRANADFFAGTAVEESVHAVNRGSA